MTAAQLVALSVAEVGPRKATPPEDGTIGDLRYMASMRMV